jgi:D-3-phosphoglycerate dehydrogenase / 2-oxoglutarate reductase
MTPATLPLPTLFWTGPDEAETKLERPVASMWPELEVSTAPSSADEAVLAGAGVIVLQGSTLSAEQLEAAVNCRAIIHAGRGPAGLDLELARRRGIVVASVPYVDDFAWGLAAQELLKGFGEAWESRRFEGMRRKPRLVLVGLGAVGVRIAEAARLLKLDVRAHDPFSLDEWFEQADARQIALLHDAVGMADILMVQVSGAEANRGLIGEAELETMPRGAWLVNAGWSASVDLVAASAAVSKGRLARAVMLHAGEPESGRERGRMDRPESRTGAGN